ncbi:MAG: hypothetical protein KBC28_04120 [Alphaproteobacteria bacterium]|nr:hypothetical protein [Alphaproteobacteria bacterium]
MPQDNETRPTVIESLFKHERSLLLGRVVLMAVYEEEISGTSLSNNPLDEIRALDKRKADFSQLSLTNLTNALLAKIDAEVR